MKSLVILAHPNIEISRVNKRWKQELLSYTKEDTIHELYQEYPHWTIDVSNEQKLLEMYQRIILQFPLYWYSFPPLLKKRIAMPYFSVFGTSFQASDEEINQSSKDYINCIIKEL